MLRRLILFASGALAAWLAFALLIRFTCAYTLVYQENIGTFYYNAQLMAPVHSADGGIAKAAALWVAQYFTSAWAASIIVGALLAVTAALFAFAFWRLTKAWWTAPLALRPSCILAVCLCMATFEFYNVMYFLLIAIAVALIALPHRTWARVAVAAVCIAALWAICGLPTSPWQAWAALAYCIVSPFIYCLVKFKTTKSQTIAAAVLLALTAFYTYKGERDQQQDSEENFYKLSVLSGQGRWNEIIEACQGIDVSDQRCQNCLNLALAQTGKLAEELLQHPTDGVASLIAPVKSPDAYMVLSDIYWAMGHLAMSQAYAFQANQAYGNLSPRLLHRLADISIVYGNYALASKYLAILEQTSQYAQWAQQRRTLLGNKDAIAKHPELGQKQACIVPDNEFIAIKGLPDDLKRILRANPKQSAAMQYLGCYLLLAKDVPAFAETIGEFYGTEALPTTLPRYFQEGIVVASIGSGERLDLTYGVPQSVMQQCQAFWQNGLNQPNTYWHYLKTHKNSTQ